VRNEAWTAKCGGYAIKNFSDAESLKSYRLAGNLHGWTINFDGFISKLDVEYFGDFYVRS
jgi:hypothetical protein